MDLSRESQTSTNTSEVEESFNCSFLLSIRYYFAFIISFLQVRNYLNFRNQTHVIAKALARPAEIKVLLEVVLVEEITDNRHCTEACLRPTAPNQAAMTQSSNRLRRFPPHEPFARLRKCDFPRIHNGDLLSNVLIDFSRYLVNAGDFFRSAPSRFPPLLFMFLWRRDPHCF